VMTEEEVYETAKGGPGTDIYVKGAWVLHTLRNLIGDKAFAEVTTRLIYGRPDPKPGNFTPRFASTPEYMTIVNQVAGRDLSWFFDVYLRQAALPALVESREGGVLRLRWKVPGDRPFPLPVEVAVDDRIVTVAMTGGRGEVAVPEGAHVVVDPHARTLRQSDAVDAYQRAALGFR
jgi:aminopeptidase N